ncbi:MAG: hypothetical protein H7227_02650 [Actinobacteria bacterium]|nr:hypothetical protein [Actinomycetota bacterium]
MRRHRFFIRLALIATVALMVVAFPAYADSPKVGVACTKIGMKYQTVGCAQINGKLIWKFKKQVQRITYSVPTQASIEAKSLSFNSQSSSKLFVSAKSLTPEICKVKIQVLNLIGLPGKCIVRLTQAGNAVYLAATSVTFKIRILGINNLDFQLPGALLLNQNFYELVASGAASALITFTSESPKICTVTGRTLRLISIGDCTVSATQAADEFFPAAEKKKSVEISTDRVRADLPDTLIGFQVKAIYVVPADGTDHRYDINGEITKVLDDGLAYLRDQLGQEVQIDSTSTGYDIGFLRSGKPSSYFLNTPGSYADLLRESKVLETPGTNRKNYVFFVDTDTVTGSSYCGEAPRPGMVAVVAIGMSQCGKQTNFFSNHASQTWIHEIFHNFGVGHVADACDLMTSGQETDGSTCRPEQLHTIDANRSMYIGASVSGVDVSKLRIWKGFTGNKELIADCYVTPTNSVNADGFKFSYCPTGVQMIGPASYCWTNVESVSLEQLVNGAWISVGIGRPLIQPWGERVDWKCKGTGFFAPSIQLSVDSPGIIHYRWVINGKVAEEMKIIWVN